MPTHLGILLSIPRSIGSLGAWSEAQLSSGGLVWSQVFVKAREALHREPRTPCALLLNVPHVSVWCPIPFFFSSVLALILCWAFFFFTALIYCLCLRLQIKGIPCSFMTFMTLWWFYGDDDVLIYGSVLLQHKYSFFFFFGWMFFQYKSGKFPPGVGMCSITLDKYLV